MLRGGEAETQVAIPLVQVEQVVQNAGAVSGVQITFAPVVGSLGAAPTSTGAAASPAAGASAGAAGPGAAGAAGAAAAAGGELVLASLQAVSDDAAHSAMSVRMRAMEGICRAFRREPQN